MIYKAEITDDTIVATRLKTEAMGDGNIGNEAAQPSVRLSMAQHLH